MIADVENANIHAMLTLLADNAEFPSLASTTGQQTFATRAVHDDSRQSTPPIPPGFEGHESRRGTPSIPPGLSRPNALPDLGDSSSRPGSRPSSRASVKRTASQILPALPLRPSTPGTRRATPSRQGSKEDYDRAVPEETPTKPSRTTTTSDLKIAMSAQDAAPSVGAGAADDDREDETASVVKASADAGKQDAEASTKQAAQMVAALSETPVSSPQIAKSTPVATPAKGKTIAPTKNADKNADSVPGATSSETPKRKHPGKIEIPAPVSRKEQGGSVNATPVDAGTPGRALSQAATTSKLSESPMPSPAVKAPRTLRLTNTPKAEAPPSNAAPVITLPSAAAHRFPSRQPSVSSINRPGTPSSEHVSMSDNISITSTSQSRANSPPPASRVGSAPVRDKTKSQQKKDRQIRAKQLEEAELAKTKAAEASKLAQETEQEAVVSRMKKSKKEKAAKPAKPTKSVNATTNNSPTVSRPPSPGPKSATPEVTANVDAPSPVVKEEPKPETPIKSTPTPPQAHVQPLQSPHEPSPPPTPTLTPAQLISELKHSAPEFQKCIDALFKVQNSHHFKTPLNVNPKELAALGGSWKPDFKLNLTKDDVDALLQGKVPAIHYGGDDNRTFDRGMVSPSGAHLRALTKELETRFLELEKALKEMPEELRFRPTKPQNDTKLPTIDLEALKQQFENSGRGPSVMEQMVQDGSTMKKGAFLVDEASKYINEFVMPPATPPPSAGGRTQHQGGGLYHGSTAEKSVPGVEITERLLSEAKRQADERESAFRKAIKKNKKAAGVA